MNRPTMNTVVYDRPERRWVIRVDPDILIKLKRWFEKIPKNAQETCELNDSPLNAFELLTFVVHFELAMSDEDRAYLEGRADAHRAKIAKVKALLSPTYEPRTFALTIPPRDYQRSAADHCIERGAVFCADEVGTGKTFVGLCVLSAPGSLPALVTCPKHLAHQWKEKIEQVLPGLRVHIVKTGSYYDLTMHRGKRVPFPDVVIVAMSKLHGWAPHLAGIVKCVIADEAHRFRHEWANQNKTVRTRAYGAMIHLRDRVPRRLFLSGTPIYNYGGEAWNVFNALEEDCLGTSTEFAREWQGSHYGFNEKTSVKDPDALGLHLRKIGAMIRRTRKDVGRELPPLTRLVEPVDLGDGDALKSVSADVAAFARLVLARNVSGFDKMTAGRELDWRVREATGIDKCMAPGTRVIMADGSVEAVENIKVGDMLLGPDSKPRRVKSTTVGQGEMYRVESTSRMPLFEPYVVNGHHILALKHSGNIRHGDRFLFAPYVKGDHIEISVDEYIQKSAHFRRLTKGYKVGIELPERKLPIDPYFVGLWLGDGISATSAVCSADQEIVDYLHEFAKTYGLNVRARNPHKVAPVYHISPAVRGGNMRKATDRNPLLKIMRGVGLIGNKRIPEDYMLSSRAQRLSLLAGLIDSDGHKNASGGYVIVCTRELMAHQISRLVMSLGFTGKIKKTSNKNQTGKVFGSYKISVFGDGLMDIPVLVERKKTTTERRQIKDALRSGVMISPVGPCTFHGFSLEGDGLFLLQDFTVTHNSPMWRASSACSSSRAGPSSWRAAARVRQPSPTGGPPYVRR